MKWLLYSDPQFDEQWTYSKPGPDGRSTRLMDQIRCLEWSFAVAEKHGCGGHLTLGDVFDSRTELTLPVIDAVCATYKRCVTEARKRDPNFRLIFLVGNHDAYLRNASITSLRMFDGYADVVSEVTQIDKLAFVPWCDNRDKYIAMLGKAEKTSAQFLFSHGLIKGSVPDPEVGYDVKLFNPARWTSVWMGDVHGPRKMADNVHYVGAPMQHHFGDAKGARGVVVLDDKTGKDTRVWNLTSPCFHIIRDDGDVAGAEHLAGHFARVEIDDAKARAAVVTELRDRGCTWIEAPVVEAEDVAAPRLDLRTASSNAEVLARYCEFKGASTPEIMSVGLELLKEAGL